MSVDCCQRFVLSARGQIRYMGLCLYVLTAGKSIRVGTLGRVRDVRIAQCVIAYRDGQDRQDRQDRHL